jgi:hypothetical protein
VQAKPAYVEATQFIVDAMIATQHGETESDAWRGTWYIPPRTAPTATRAEALGAAHQLLARAGDRAAAHVVRASLERASAWLMHAQFTASRVAKFPNPQSALGGMPESLDNPEIRIDYVQHTLSAWLGLWRIETKR